MKVGLIEKTVFSSLKNLQEQVILGPVRYQPELDSKLKVKIYTFCRDSFPELSSRSIRQCFVEGCVQLNGTPLHPGHESETLRLQLGDEVTIKFCWNDVVRGSDSFRDLNIIEENNNFAIVEKGPGLDTSRNSLFGVCFRLKLWSGRHFDTAQAVYDLPRSHHGLLILVPSIVEFENVVRRLAQNQIQLCFSSIICADILETEQVVFSSSPCTQSIPETINSFIKGLCEFDGFKIVRVRQCSSRAVDTLSMIEVTIQFLSPALSSTSHPFNWLSQALQTCCHYLTNVLKMPVVGYDKILNTHHGVFMSWNKIVYDWNSESERIYMLPAPRKFVKYLETEERLFEKAAEASLRHNEDLDLKLRKLTVFQNSPPNYSNEFHQELSNALFCDLIFKVSSDVMMPRISSETVVNAAVEHICKNCFVDSCEDNRQSLQILDLGTGSGNLLISILHRIAQRQPLLKKLHLRGIGVDVSENALKIARLNGTYLQQLIRSPNVQKEDLNDPFLSTDIQFSSGDFATPDHLTHIIHQHSIHHGLDAIVCNPPYSSKSEQRISESVKRRDPSLALFAHETDALWAYRQLAECLSSNIFSLCLVPNKTLLILEIGHGQQNRVQRIFESVPGSIWHLEEARKDHKNLQRALVFRYCR
jgi:HemK-like putative methylase